MTKKGDLPGSEKESSNPLLHKSKFKKTKRWPLVYCTCFGSKVAEPSLEVHEVHNAVVPPPAADAPRIEPLPLPPSQEEVPEEEEVKVVQVEEEEDKHAISVALASDVVAEESAVSAHDGVEVVSLITPMRFSSSSPKEEAAAVKIQTAFRGFMARRALRGLRGLVRLKSIMQSNAVKRQTTNSLHCMQTMARVQSQIRSRRIRMLEENRALQRQLQLKHEKDLEKLRLGEEWDDSFHSKEQIEAGLLHKQEAAVRRERALAYAFTHQWRNSSKPVNPLFMDPTNPQWGWSWLDRWTPARPFDTKSAADINSDAASIKSSTQSVGGDILKAYARRDVISPMAQKSIRPPSHQSPAFQKGKTSPSRVPSEDDAGSMLSSKSDRPRRHSIAESSVADNESLVSSPSGPSYMAQTQSTKARSRFQSPSGEKQDTPEKKSPNSIKKRLSFDKNSGPSPVHPRRYSGPPKIDVASLKESRVHSSDNGNNNGPDK